MTAQPAAVHDARFTGPGAWTRSSFQGPSDWTWELSSAVVAELEDALDHIRTRGKQLDTLTRVDFPLPSFSAGASRLGAELRDGRGFVVVRGLPIDRCSPEEATMLYWGLGAHLGSTQPQNVKGDRVYFVRDEGYTIARDYGTVGVRFSKTTEGLDFHTDTAPAFFGETAEIVGLLALEVAKSGGETALASGQALHNVLRDERPDLLARLYQPYHFDRSAEPQPGLAPTLFAPVFTYDGALAVRYFRFYVPKGHALVGEPLTDADLEALDYFDTVARRPELQVTFSMRRGDIQFVNNTFILHSRTPFEDHPEPVRRRHLVRLWLKPHSVG